MLVRHPLVSAIAALSVALGTAATSTIFTVTDALLVRAAPGVRDADRVVDIGRTTNGTGFDNMSYPAFRYLADHTETLTSIAATTFDTAPLGLTFGGTSERVHGHLVSASYFDVLQIRPAIGRFFLPEEDAVAEARPVVVLSHRFWQARFQADPRVLERPLRLNHVDFTVVGVAEDGFEGSTIVGTDLWAPIAMAGTVLGSPGSSLLTNPRSVWHIAVGRLAPDATAASAQAELNTLFAAFKAVTPTAPAAHGIAVERTARLPPPIRLPFGAFTGLLFALAAALLAVACSNVAGMLLARATARRREMATRVAVGASRGQLLRQLLVETLLLFGVACALALPLTVWFAALLEAFLPALPIPLRLDLALTARTGVFAVAVTMVAGLVFGLTPARHALRADLSSVLHGRLSTAGPDRVRARRALVIAQVALSLTMLVAAGLFVRALVAAARLESGFRMADVEIVSLDVTLAGVDEARVGPFVGRVVDAVRAVAGVEAVGHARVIPLQGSGFGLGRLRIPGLDDAALDRLDPDWDVVSPDYFDAVGLPIREGRGFSLDDRADRPLVAIVNETFARTAWPGRSPLGQRVWQMHSPEERPLEIVGVARDARYRTWGEAPRAFIYVPFAQQPQTRVELFVKHAPGQSVGADVRAAIQRAEPSLPVLFVQPFREATALGLLPQRLAAWVAGSVGAVGLLLAALGLYGLMAFLVAQRAREFAIRMALGASARDVRAIVFGEAARLGAAGAVVGAGGGAALGVVVERMHLLLGVPSVDPVTLGVASLPAVALVLLGSYAPTRRAAASDPAAALRGEG